MSVVARDIKVESYTISELFAAVERGGFVIPTFQRDVLWRHERIANLWDSMYRGFPIGSLLYWETAERLDLIREVGGFPLSAERPEEREREYRYILDGQQRLTAIYVAMKGGGDRIEGDTAFDYTLYFDPTASLAGAENGDDDDADTVDEQDDVPDTSRFFLFAKAANRRRAQLTRSGLPAELIVRVADPDATSFDRILKLASLPAVPREALDNLNQLHRLLHAYNIPMERVRGVDLAEVCDIFVRMNKSARTLDPVDIIAAQMFRAGESGFNLRSLFADIRNELASRQPAWRQVKSLALMQMIGVCMRERSLRERPGEAASFGISSKQMFNLTASVIKPHWDEIRQTIIQTLTFLISEGIYQPSAVPSTYLLLPLCAYFFRHTPNEWERRLIAQWFWRSAFDPRSISQPQDIERARAEFFSLLRDGRTPTLKPLIVSN